MPHFRQLTVEAKKRARDLTVYGEANARVKSGKLAKTTPAKVRFLSIVEIIPVAGSNYFIAQPLTHPKQFALTDEMDFNGMLSGMQVLISPDQGCDSKLQLMALSKKGFNEDNNTKYHVTELVHSEFREPFKSFETYLRGKRSLQFGILITVQ